MAVPGFKPFGRRTSRKSRFQIQEELDSQYMDERSRATPRPTTQPPVLGPSGSREKRVSDFALRRTKDFKGSIPSQLWQFAQTPEFDVVTAPLPIPIGAAIGGVKSVAKPVIKGVGSGIDMWKGIGKKSPFTQKVEEQLSKAKPGTSTHAKLKGIVERERLYDAMKVGNAQDIFNAGKPGHYGWKMDIGNKARSVYNQMIFSQGLRQWSYVKDLVLEFDPRWIELAPNKAIKTTLEKIAKGPSKSELAEAKKQLKTEPWRKLEDIFAHGQMDKLSVTNQIRYDKWFGQRTIDFNNYVNEIAFNMLKIELKQSKGLPIVVDRALIEAAAGLDYVDSSSLGGPLTRAAHRLTPFSKRYGGKALQQEVDEAVSLPWPWQNLKGKEYIEAKKLLEKWTKLREKWARAGIDGGTQNNKARNALAKMAEEHPELQKRFQEIIRKRYGSKIIVFRGSMIPKGNLLEPTGEYISVSLRPQPAHEFAQGMYSGRNVEQSSVQAMVIDVEDIVAHGALMESELIIKSSRTRELGGFIPIIIPEEQ